MYSVQYPPGLGTGDQGLDTRYQILGTPDWGLGTRYYGLWTMDHGLGTGNQGLDTMDQGLGTRDWGLGTRYQILGTRDSGLGTRDQILWTMDSGLGNRDKGLRTRDQGLKNRGQQSCKKICLVRHPDFQPKNVRITYLVNFVTILGLKYTQNCFLLIQSCLELNVSIILRPNMLRLIAPISKCPDFLPEMSSIQDTTLLQLWGLGTETKLFQAEYFRLESCTFFRSFKYF